MVAAQPAPHSSSSSGLIPPATLVVGSRHRLLIEDVGFGGEGVGRINGFVIFVPFVIVGEDIETEIVEVKRQFARGRLCQVIKTSPDRVIPPCQYFGQCGGCQYQHLAYPRQLALKQKQIQDLFQRIGGLGPVLVDAVVPCPQPFHYRNRILVRSQWDKFKQGLNIGFIRAENRLVVDLVECLIADPELNRQLSLLRQHPPPKGGIKVQLRLAATDWVVPNHSFFQNNFHMLSSLLEAARRRIQDSGVRYLIDLYCGVGFFGIELANQVEAFVGVEIDVQAVKAAEINASRRKCANGLFLAGTAEEHMPKLLDRFPSDQTVVVLDPPRGGCSADMLELLRQMRPRQMLYVSCHPATLARDLNLLCADRVYEVVRVTPLDLFPQTQHVECVVDLRLHGLCSER
jgi:tRNA/tmRNA/rRNA uracil-C5-methylase (TrmA/RlmC/RlmD family)